MLVEPLVAERIETCTFCARSINAAAPAAGEPLELALCACGRRHYVRAVEEGHPALLVGDDAYRGFSPVRHLSAQRSSAVESLIHKLGSGEPVKPYELYEGGQSLRSAIALPLMAAPLDEGFRPTQEAVDAASIHISTVGIAIASPTNQHASFCLIDFGPAGHPGSQAVIKLVRSNSRDDGMWEIAGPFASVLDEKHKTAGRLLHTSRHR